MAGVGPRLVIGVGIFVVGPVLVLVRRTRDGRYWQERPGIASMSRRTCAECPDGEHGACYPGPRRDGRRDPNRVACSKA